MRVLFVGSRCPVFDAAMELGMGVETVLAVRGSMLHRHAAEAGIRCVPFEDKKHLLAEISDRGFDLLVSNGCPYVLPVSALRTAGQQFVNVHPSLLPNLRGRHPVNGAVLFDQPLGASCHVMDDSIDTGPLIARVHVHAEEGADLGLLYRLAFMAEADAFRKAYARGFAPGDDGLGHLAGGGLYFTRSAGAMQIDFSEPIECTVRRVAAFSVPGQYAAFRCGDTVCTVARAARVVSRFLEEKFEHIAPGTLVMRYDDTVLFKLQDGYLRLSGLTGDLSRLQEGMTVAGGVGQEAAFH